MKNSVLLENVNSEEFAKLITEEIKIQLNILKKELGVHKSEELLTRDEACEFLKINSSTLWSYTNKGRLKALGIGARRYYLKSQILESLTLKK
jgi:hypothetical protein